MSIHVLATSIPVHLQVRKVQILQRPVLRKDPEEVDEVVAAQGVP